LLSGRCGKTKEGFLMVEKLNKIVIKEYYTIHITDEELDELREDQDIVDLYQDTDLKHIEWELYD